MTLMEIRCPLCGDLFALAAGQAPRPCRCGFLSVGTPEAVERGIRTAWTEGTGEAPTKDGDRYEAENHPAIPS